MIYPAVGRTFDAVNDLIVECAVSGSTAGGEAYDFHYSS
jgi:hypothetical protein